MRPGEGARAQTIGVLVAWLAIVLFHLSNDGLWFGGDAARHALNGLFWSDFLSALPADPRDYVLRYYARYPAITPASYPPGFYLLEALAFRLIAPSPFVAKGLVLGFALAAALVVAAWLRRYVSPRAGWGGVLLVLQPGIVVWSNAVMLNVPAMTLGVITLYCARAWIEAPSARRLLLTLTCGAATALTYFPAALVVVVSWLWLGMEGRWRWLWKRHRLIVVAVLAAAVVLLLLVGRVPLPFALAYTTFAELRNPDKWLFYLYMQPRLLSPWILGLAVLALPAAGFDPRTRRDVRLLIIWVIVTYTGLSYFWSRAARYALLFAPAIVMLAVIALKATLERIGAWVDRDVPSAFVPMLITLIALQAWTAQGVRVPSIDGFRDVARFVTREAPTERVLYEGRNDGIFTFYVRAEDNDFRHAVVRGSKLLYASAVLPTWRLTERVASIADVDQALKNSCGCGWILVERSTEAEEIGAARLLHEAVQGPQFRLVRSVPVHARSVTQVDVYEYLERFATPAELSLPFPVLGESVVYSARPIER